MVEMSKNGEPSRRNNSVKISEKVKNRVYQFSTVQYSKVKLSPIDSVYRLFLVDVALMNLINIMAATFILLLTSWL